MNEKQLPAKETNIHEIERIIEAILFAAGYPVTYERLAQTLQMTPGEVKKTVRHFRDRYNDPTAGRGIMLLCLDDCCQLCTVEDYMPYIREALGIRRGGNLSPSSLEVLAIVAYHEPVTRAYIDTVRGVDSSYAVNALCDKHLLEPCGRLDAPGRPVLYRTTPDFLRCFGIDSLTELPQIPLEKPGGDGTPEQTVLPLDAQEVTPSQPEDPPARPEDGADSDAAKIPPADPSEIKSVFPKEDAQI